MKRISQIAKDCNVPYYEVNEIIRKEEFVLSKNKFRVLTPQQEDLVHNILYFEGKITEITLESKMNIPEIQESFSDFKTRTYGR